MTTDTPTPRTDAEIVLSATTGTMMVPADFARDLERDLSECRAALAQLEFTSNEALRFVTAESNDLRAALAERQAAIDELVATDDARKDLEARYMSFTSYGGFQVASDGVKRRQRAAIDTARALATKEPVDIGSYAQSVGWDSGLATKEPQP